MKIITIIAAAIISIVFLCCARTYILTISQSKPASICHADEADGYISADDEPWHHFKKSLEFETVSFSPGDYNRKELKKFQDFLFESYPRVFSSSLVSYNIVNELSLLITVRGQNSSLTPYLLAAHLDVVPVVQDEWTYPGFKPNENKNRTMVYSRGAIDDKACVIAIMESLSFMLSRGVQPQRGFYVAFGHDEEVGGEDGAGEIAKELRRQGVTQLDFVFDEGNPILQNLFPGIKKPIAGIGVSEKGRLTLNLTVHAEGGHSSVPSRHSSVGILAAAIQRLEANPHSIIFDDLTQNFISSMSLEMPFPLNVITSNLWLTKPLVALFLSRGVTQSLIRTTTAVTMFRGGVKTNVIPPSAWATVNHRIHPKQTVDEIIKLDKSIINDKTIRITPLHGAMDPHPISPHDSDKDRPFNIIKKTIHQVHPDAIIGPVTFVANTDTLHYLGFTKHVFRMYPFILDTKTEILRIHGRDERLSKQNFESALNFYYHLMLNANVDWKAESHSHTADL